MQRFVIIHCSLLAGPYPISQLPGWLSRHQGAAAVARRRASGSFSVEGTPGGSGTLTHVVVLCAWISGGHTALSDRQAVVRMTLELGILPPMLRDVRRPRRMVRRNIVISTAVGFVLFSRIFRPLFYLLSMRVG